MGAFSLIPTILTLLGFTVGIIATNLVYGYIYEKSQNIVVLMLLHATMNAVTSTLGVVLNNPLASIIPQIFMWVVVFAIDKFDPEEKKSGNLATNKARN